MRRSIIHYTAISLAVPGMLGLMFSTFLLVMLVAGLINASQGAPDSESIGYLEGASGIATVAFSYLFSIAIFFFSCILWGMELLLEKAEKRDRLLNEQITAIFELQKLMTQYEESTRTRALGNRPADPADILLPRGGSVDDGGEAD